MKTGGECGKCNVLHGDGYTNVAVRTLYCCKHGTSAMSIRCDTQPPVQVRAPRYIWQPTVPHILDVSAGPETCGRLSIVREPKLTILQSRLAISHSGITP